MDRKDTDITITNYNDDITTLTFDGTVQAIVYRNWRSNYAGWTWQGTEEGYLKGQHFQGERDDDFDGIAIADAQRALRDAVATLTVA